MLTRLAYNESDVSSKATTDILGYMDVTATYADMPTPDAKESLVDTLGL